MSTQSRDVKDGKIADVLREPEQVKAFRDTWKDGIHSYLTYLRDRVTVARELLSKSGSIFVQIGDENVHRIRAVMDEVFGAENYISETYFQKTGSSTASHIQNLFDTILWFACSKAQLKSRRLKKTRDMGDLRQDITHWLTELDFAARKLNSDELATTLNRTSLNVFTLGPINSQHFSVTRTVPFGFQREQYTPPPNRQWTYDLDEELICFSRAYFLSRYENTLRVKMLRSDKASVPLTNLWTDTQLGGVSSDRLYVV